MLQRSSETIGNLAAALAKAQGELTNPEKSLVGTLPASGRGETGKTFRYASLSSGLDIVRRVLGQHEIATMQTTATDRAAGIVNLTTVLAHASGEWIASDWPVCAVAETATPHRMGMALTYARRYSLFALVGIAGEDDLDAPDLIAPVNPAPSEDAPDDKASSNGRLNGCQRGGVPSVSPRRDAKMQSPKQSLGVEASAELRDQLIAELSRITSSDDAGLWAHRSLGEKNKLTTADAHQVEQAFTARITDLAIAEVSPKPEVQPTHSQTTRPNKPKNHNRTAGIDKSALPLPEPRRLRDRDHVKFVATHACLICGRQPADAHHLRFMQSRALGRKVSDEFTVPLCRGHHREVHRSGDEATWWKKIGVDPTTTARTLWLRTHPLPAQPKTSRANYETEPTERPV